MQGFLRVAGALLLFAMIMAFAMVLGEFVPGWIKASVFAVSLILTVATTSEKLERWAFIVLLMAGLTFWTRPIFYALIDNRAADWLSGWELVVCSSLSVVFCLFLSGTMASYIWQNSGSGLEEGDLKQFWYIILITFLGLLVMP